MRRTFLALFAVATIAACSIRIENPSSGSEQIGQGEYIEASGNITVAFSVLSYRAIERFDSTIFPTDSINAFAIAWVRDTFQNPIASAHVTLYVDSLIPIPMTYVDTLEAYVAPLTSFFGSYYIVDVRTDDGYLRAKFWNPTVGIDSVYLGVVPVEAEDTVAAPIDGDEIILGLFPLDDRPVVILEADTLPLYAPYVALLSIPMDLQHGTHVKFYRGFASPRDTIVFDSAMISKLFPYDNMQYEFYVVVANIDTTTSIPPINMFDINMSVRKLLEMMNHSGVITISDVFRFYVVK